MNINGSKPIPATEHEAPTPVHKAPHVSADAAVPKDKVVQKPLNITNTDVVVEMERNNTLVYKFIDETTGKVIQQFPPEQMVNQQQAALPEISGKAAGPKQA